MSRWWRGRSVRVRLTLWYSGALAVVLALYAGGVFVFVSRGLSEVLNRELREDFDLAESMLERTVGDGVRWRANEHEDQEDTGVINWIAVWTREGKLLYRSASVEAGDADRIGATVPPEQRGYSSLALPGAGHVRVLSDALSIDGLPVLVRVARSEEGLRRELRELFFVLVLGFPLALGIAGFGGYALARGVLAPVSRMTDQARMITAERLGQRLPVVNPHDELGQLARVFNDTFARLERSFDQLRRFTADASHELRTPLTAIRSVGEVGLRGHHDERAYREVIGSMLEESDRLARLVDSLLTLSRADGGHVKLTRERTDLVELAREVVSHLSVLAEEKLQSITIEAPGPVYTFVDRLVLRQAVVNLVDNAIKYSPHKSRIRIVAAVHGDGPVLEVRDAGPGIPPEHQEHVFERFYRVDKARARELGGTGLGLAIARWAVEAHGGHLEVDSEEGEGSTFRIRLSPA